MKIGIFDSGLGGLAIARAVLDRLPEYDVIYLGDSRRAPYGNRSQETIHQFTTEALDFLFERDCQLIVLACNTASAEALRRSQQEYLPARYPDRRVLGVVIPAAEVAAASSPGGSYGILATASTVESGSFPREIQKLDAKARVVQMAAPLLVPLVENDGLKYVGPILDDYLASVRNVDSLILGCTHYCLIKDMVRDRTTANVISQDEVVPEKLADYLDRHPEIETKLARNAKREFYVTDLTEPYQRFGERLWGQKIPLSVVAL